MVIDEHALSADCFSAVPSADNAARVHQRYREMLKSSILLSIDSAAEGLEADLSHIRALFEPLDPRQKFSPALFAAQSDLTDALASGNVTRVLEALQQLRLLTNDVVLDTDFRVESILTERWEPSFLRDVRAGAPAETEENGLILRPILDPDISDYVDAITAATDLLAEIDPPMLAEFDEYVTRVKLFDGRGVYGFTTPKAFGAIFLKLPPSSDDTAYYLEHLVHELSHLTLNALMAHDPLLKNPLEENVPSPLRPDPRPLYQVMHATFVLSRTVRVFRLLVEETTGTPHRELLTEFERQYAEGYATIDRQAELTEMGRRIVDSMSDPLGERAANLSP